MTLFLAKSFVAQAAVSAGMAATDWRGLPEGDLRDAYLDGLKRQFALGWSTLRELAAHVKATGPAMVFPFEDTGAKAALADDLLRLVGAAHCNQVLREQLGVSLALMQPGMLWLGPAGTEPPASDVTADGLSAEYPSGWAFLNRKAMEVRTAQRVIRFDVHPEEEALLVAELIGLMAYSDHRTVVERAFGVAIRWAHCCGVFIGLPHRPPEISLIEQMELQIDQGMRC